VCKAGEVTNPSLGANTAGQFAALERQGRRTAFTSGVRSIKASDESIAVGHWLGRISAQSFLVASLMVRALSCTRAFTLDVLFSIWNFYFSLQRQWQPCKPMTHTVSPGSDLRTSQAIVVCLNFF
jgi:hypothetical protein